MRIVHLITRLIVGGAQENTLLSCEGQHDLGHEVTLITGPAIGPEGSLMERAASYGYRVEVVDDMRRSIHPLKDFRTYRRLVQRLNAIRPDVVHTHSSKAGILGRWAAKAARVPVVVHTIHGLAFTASTSRLVNGVYKLLERQTAPLTTKIVCVADSMRDQSLAGHVGRPDQYVTIYSGMETGPFVNPPMPREEIRRRLGLADSHIVVGTIARLFHLKGHDDLLDIAPDLCARFPNLRFLWVGDGLLRPVFEKRMDQMGLRDRFILTGLVPPQRVPELTNAMDVLVHPSRREGLARALPQGSLAAKPVVTYDIDGAKEGVIEGQTGFVLPPFDCAKLSGAIAVLLKDEPLRGRMGSAGRRFALGRFDAGVMVRRLDELYRAEIALIPSSGTPGRVRVGVRAAKTGLRGVVTSREPPPLPSPGVPEEGDACMKSRYDRRRARGTLRREWNVISNQKRRGATWVLWAACAAAGMGMVIPFVQSSVALAAPGQAAPPPRERDRSKPADPPKGQDSTKPAEPPKPPEFPGLKPVLDDRVTAVEKDIAALIMHRTGTTAAGLAQLEMAIDLRIIQRWLLQRAIAAHPESREQIAALLRLDQMDAVTSELEGALKSLASTPPTSTQSQAMVKVHQISYDLKPDADGKTIDEVCRATALALLNVANPTPIDPQAVPVMRPGKIESRKGPQPETSEPRSLSALADEISRATVSPPVRAQLLALLAETQAAVKANDKQAGPLQQVLTDSVDLAKGLAGNAAMSAQTRTDVETNFAEGLALFSDPRMRAAGMTRIQALAQYRQMIARVARMKMSPEVRGKVGPAISWAQNHVEQGGKVLGSIDQFLDLSAQYEAVPKAAGAFANLRRMTDDAGKVFEKDRDAFLSTTAEMSSASATTAAPDTLESELGDMRVALDFYQTMAGLPQAIETLNAYKPKPFGALEQRVIKNAVAAANTVKSPATAAARSFLVDVVKLARSSDAVGLKSIADLPPAVTTAWVGGPLTDFGNKCRSLVTELATQAAAGTEMDAKKMARLDAVPQLIGALRDAATLEATFARGAPLQRWVDWGLTPELVHTTLAPYQQAVGGAFSGFVSDTPDAVEKFMSSRGEYVALIAMVNRDAAYIEPCSKFPGGLAGDLAQLATPLEGQPFATERYVTFALKVSALYSGTDLDAGRAASSAALRRLTREGEK